jgi:nitrate reductase NapA
VNKDFVDKHTTFLKGATDIGYGLRPDIPLRSRRTPGADPRHDADRLRRLRQVREGLHAGEHSKLTGVEPGFLQAAGRALCRSQDAR